MKQVAQSQRGGDLRVVEAPVPALRAGGVLVRTAYSLISAGTERAKIDLASKSLVGKAKARPEQVRKVLRAFRDQGFQDTYRRVSNRLSALEPLGYSCSGVISEVGEGVRGFETGDHVACAGAGYANHAEVNFVPMNLCARVPGGEKFLEAAAFTTVGSIAMQGVRQAEVHVGEVAVVIGLGLIGLITVQILKAAGCVVAGADPDEKRRRIALAGGCDAVSASAADLIAAVQQLSGGFGADAVLITAASTSNGPIETAARVARDRGRVVVVGAVRLDVPRQPFYDKELELRLSRSYGPGRYDAQYEERGHDYPIGYVRWTEQRNMQSFLRLLADGRIDMQPLITHRFAIAEAERAYALITGNAEPYLGVILDYGISGTLARDDSRRPLSGTPVTVAKTERRPLAATPREVVRLGLIGAGSFAQNTLIPALKADGRVELRAVVTSSGLTAQSVAKRFGFAVAGSDAASILESSEIDAVVIATRHDSHATLAAEAMRRGKAVFLEKPLAIDDAGLAEVVKAREASSSDVMVGFNRRFAPATAAVKEWFAGVAEPKVLTCRVNAGFIDPGHWAHDPEVGGGRIVGEGCHFFDLFGFIVGAKPVEVEATGLPDGGRYTRDNVLVRVRYADGSIATLTYLANGSAGVAKEYIEVFGGGRVGIIDDFRRVILASDGKEKRIGGRFAKQDKGHKQEVAAFLGAIRGGAPSPIAFEDLVTTSRVSFSAMESLRSGRAVSL